MLVLKLVLVKVLGLKLVLNQIWKQEGMGWVSAFVHLLFVAVAVAIVKRVAGASWLLSAVTP